MEFSRPHMEARDGQQLFCVFWVGTRLGAICRGVLGPCRQGKLSLFKH